MGELTISNQTLTKDGLEASENMFFIEEKRSASLFPLLHASLHEISSLALIEQMLKQLC